MRTPSSLRTELEEALNRVLRDEWSNSLPKDFTACVAESDNRDFGDLTCNCAMQLAGILKQNPRKIAEEILKNADMPDGISTTSVDGPGFLNFTLSGEYLVQNSLGFAALGLQSYIPDLGGGGEALVEYVSSNPTGPLTVGHCRQAVLGEALASLLESTGWKVSREYYFNDGGRQMRLLGESLAARYESIGPFDISPPEDGYQGEYVKEWAQDLRKSEGAGLSWNDDPQQFIHYARERALQMIKEDLALLDITFDRFFAESELIPDSVEAAIEALSAANAEQDGLVYKDPEDDRKKWLRLTSLGRPKDRVIVREDGSYTYRMPDIAYHIDKFERGYDLIVDVFGADHLDTSRDVTAALGALLGDDEVNERLRVVIHQFVTLLRDGGRTKMSTRTGNFVTMGELVEDVGSADVTRYLFLTRRAEAHMDFDLDLARKQSMDNPVYYVQYAHARIAGILEKAAEQGIRIAGEYSDELAAMLDGDHERELMRLLESVPMEVASASAALEPHRITETLAKLATGFHRFYQKVPVVNCEEPRLSSARLILCEACRRSIADLLGILGVEAPDEM